MVTEFFPVRVRVSVLWKDMHQLPKILLREMSFHDL